MLNNSVVVGVSQVSSWGPTDTVEGVLRKLGANSGNMMFTESLKRILKSQASTSFDIPDSALEGRDSIVIAAANWINEFEDFSWLANRLEQINLPVFLIGVGAQAGLDHSIPSLQPGTLRLLKIVAERSKVIAARGQFTCDVLNKYGITNVIPTGCPSMLLCGKNGPSMKSGLSSDSIVLHGTRHGFGRTNSFQNWLYREAMENDWEIMLQSEYADIYYALGKLNNDKIMAMAEPAVQFSYGTDETACIAAYLKRKGRFFTNFSSWISHMGQQSFCVGTRIHGTVASIVSGTPAVLIAHDSRTLEMAETMNIPYVLSSDLSQEHSLPLDMLLDVYENGKEFAGYSKYYRTFINLFKENDLELVAGSD